MFRPCLAEYLSRVYGSTPQRTMMVQGDRPMRFRPLQDRVLIRRVEEEEKTAGGIIIPDTAKDKPMEGEGVAAGPGAPADNRSIRPLDVQAADRALFAN